MKDLSDLDRDLLLRWFMFHLSMVQRQRLMHELPLIYNRAVDDTVMRVTNVKELTEEED